MSWKNITFTIDDTYDNTSNVNISATHSVINAIVAAKNIRFLAFGVNAKIERKKIIENRSILIVL